MQADTKRIPFTAESTTKLSEILSSARREEHFPAPSSQIPAKNYPELYQKVFYRLSQVAKDKALLEVSLRSEMTTSEEQKAYIEVLKQALEARMEDLGIRDSLKYDHFEALSTLKNDSDYSKREVMKLRYDLKNSQDVCAKLRATIDGLFREAEDLKRERIQAVKERDRALKAADDAEYALKTLEDEKNALLDYVEETNLQELKGQLMALQEEREELMQTSAEIESKNNELEDIIAKQESELEELRNAYEEIQRDHARLSDVESELEAARTQIDIQQQTSEAEKEQLSVNEVALEGLRSQVKEQSEYIKHLTAEVKRLEEIEAKDEASIESLSKKLEEATSTNKTLYQANKQKDTELAEASKACEGYETSRSDTESQLKLALSQLGEKKEQVEALQKSVDNFREALSSEKKESSALFDEVLESRKKLKELADKLNIKTEEFFLLEKRLEEAKGELARTLQAASTASEQSIKSYNERLATVTSAHSTLLQENFALRREIADMKGKVAESESLANTVEDLNETLKKIANDKVKLAERVQELDEVSHFVKESNQLVKLLADRPLPQKTAMLLERWKSRSIRGQEYIEWMRLLSEEVLESEESLRHLKDTAEGLRSELNLSNLRSSERERILKQELKTVEKERDYLASTKEGYSKRLESANSEVASLKTQLNALRMELDSLLVSKPKSPLEYDRLSYLALEEKVKRLQSSKSDLERVLTESESSTSNLVRACGELARLWTEIEELDRERDRLRSQVKAAEYSLRAEGRKDAEVFALKLRDLEAWREMKLSQKQAIEQEVVSLSKRVHREISV
mmetsp:Transcript_16028/g.29363  ORF Transcript_16028/g.29363 Transcript_16028/m.29363 type:complete len:808 (+) Transcript_16028:886-3309(+)